MKQGLFALEISQEKHIGEMCASGILKGKLIGGTCASEILQGKLIDRTCASEILQGKLIGGPCASEILQGKHIGGTCAFGIPQGKLIDRARTSAVLFLTYGNKFVTWKPHRSFRTSPAMISPATDGTNALLPGTWLRTAHVLFVPGGQTQ